MIVFQCNKKFSHVTFVQKLIVSLKTCTTKSFFFFFFFLLYIDHKHK